MRYAADVHDPEIGVRMLRSAAALESKLGRKRGHMEDNKVGLQGAGWDARPGKLPLENNRRNHWQTVSASLI
jgi:hypothetical protein